MSTDQPLNAQTQHPQYVAPDAVEETKRQIQAIVKEIAALTRQELEPTIYYGEFLQRVLSALAAVSGAIWTVRKDSGLELAYQINLQQTFPPDQGDDQARHSRLLYQALRSGENMLVPPFSGSGGEEEAGNPTKYLLILVPILAEDKPVGVVEIFQRATSGPASQRGYLKFLTEMCEHVGNYLRARRLKELADWQDLFTQVDRFSRGVHESLDPRTTAYTIANEGRRLIGCDRVSVALRKGRKCIVEAVSGQDTMDTRANSVVLLSKLSTAVMRSAEPLWYTGDSTDLPPQIEDAVHNYVDETHTKTVAVLPLFKPSDYVPDGDEAKRLLEEKEEVIGCLIVEQIEDSRDPAEFAQGVELVSEHSARALSNAVEHNSLFLMPVWRAIGKAGWVLRARTLPKTLAVAALILAGIAALIFVPYDFEMSAKGKLQPENRREVFVEVDGNVIEVDCEHGDIVEKGERLLQLRNSEIDRQIVTIDGQLDSLRQSLRIADRTRSDKSLDQGERLQAVQDFIQANVKIVSLEQERKLREEQKGMLTVRSPIAGKIVYPHYIRRELEGRPVVRGNNVMTVADLNGEWVLDVNMEEDNMGHLTAALAKATPDENGVKSLDVEYILKSDPENKLQGVIRSNRIHDAAQLHEEYGHTVLMTVDINKEDLNGPLPGTEVTVRVACGKKPIGYVWFHKLIEFLQSRWFL